MASPFGDHPIRILCRCLRSPQRLLGGATEKESPELAEALQDVISSHVSGGELDTCMYRWLPASFLAFPPIARIDVGQASLGLLII